MRKVLILTVLLLLSICPKLIAININDVNGITTHALQSSALELISKDHRKWANEFHQGVKDIDRYTKNIEEVIGQKIIIKPKPIKIEGIKMRISMRSEIKNGGMAEIKNASNFAYNGDTFYSVTVDHSKCKSKENFSDCKQDSGSSRVELIADEYWTWKNGTEKWVNYAVMPAKNILFDGRSRRFTVGQCHPLSGETINWMIKFRDKSLVLQQNFKSHKNDDGTWIKSNYDTYHHLKKFKSNENNGSNEWTNIRIQFKNTHKPDGVLRVWVDDNLTYEYLGPTAWKGDRDRCTFKLGLYTNANLTSVNKEERENMLIFLDSMAVAKNEIDLIKKLKKDR